MLHTGPLMGDNMIRLTSFVLVFISTFIVACSETSHKSDITEVTDFESNIGWLHGSCLAIKNTNLSKGARVIIVKLDEPQVITMATVSNKAMGGDKCFPLLEDRRKINVENGYSFYLVNSELDINLGISVVAKEMNIEEYAFDYCTTTEGVVYSLKKIDKNNDDILWRGYYYLGYDSEATCDTESKN